MPGTVGEIQYQRYPRGKLRRLFSFSVPVVEIDTRAATGAQVREAESQELTAKSFVFSYGPLFSLMYEQTAT
jgi:hypothetical protein